MASLNCFRPHKKKKEKKGEKEVNTMHVKLDHLQKSSEATELRSTSFNVDVPFPIPESCRCEVKVMNAESPVAGEAAYEGEDEHDEAASRLDRDSEFNLQAPCEDMNDGDFDFQACFENQNDHSNTEVMFASGHASDPGTVKPRFWASPELKRSCSNLAMRSVSLELEDPVLVSNCKSYEDLQRLAEMHDGGSPASRCTADNVILKKHSSSQILPSGSRKLWWKLFLWSHRNLHTKPLLSPVNQHQHGGYSSDIAEPKHATGSRKLMSPSPSSLTEESADKNWDGFHNQWFAFPPDSSPLWRVGEWVKEASSQVDHDHHDAAFPPSPDNSASASASPPSRPSATNMLDDEVSHANNAIRSLNTNSTVAHISGLGLGAIPSISLFSSLRSLNLSANLIVQITPGSLPKGLHILNLSRNKISNIEGLRELTRLRVLDLSYNRISRIGQGLSNCTLVKELYLAGNKISIVEGLHRLLKLTVLDLSFNKITTVKALGQLVANYNSLIAVNLLGNPIHNMSDDLLRKTLCSLLPKLALLNKQPINPQKAREIRGDANAKAALGNSGWNTRRKVVRKVAAPGTSSSHSVRRSTVSNSQRNNKHKAKSHSRHHSTFKDKA